MKQNLKNTGRRKWLYAAGIVAACLLYSCKNEPVILYDATFQQVKDSAQKEGKAFCVVLSNTDCPPCALYVQHLDHPKRQNLLRKAVFNIVDVSLPENRWYMQWICSGSFPTTCVFSPEGALKAIVSGLTGTAMQCVETALDGGDVKCADYFYKKQYPVREGGEIALLNALLDCKQAFDRGEDITASIDACLRQTDYPYPAYLKCLNEEKQGRHDEAAYWAKHLMEFNHPYHLYLYSDLQAQMKSIINPGYTPADDALLSVNNELRLAHCKLHQAMPFSIEVTNTGKLPLLIREILLSCSCLKLTGEKQFLLQVGESKKVAFEFTADAKGEIYREVTFISDAANPVQPVAIRAQAE